MKRPRIAGVGACAGVLSAVLAFGGDPASARELIYSSAIPAKHPLHEFGLKQYFENVTKDTGGSLTFELFPGGTLASAKTTLNAVRTGSVDMGLLADIYNPNDLPVSTLVSDLAVLGKDARVMTGAVNETIAIDCEECKQDYLEENILPLASYSLTPYYLMCVDAEITSIEHMKGKKVRATGAMGQLVAGVGGTAVNITSSEIYEALQRGQADCALGPMPWLKTYSLWDLVKTVTDSGVGTYHGTNFLNVNTKSWEKLSAEEKAAMGKHLASAVRTMAEIYEKDDVRIKQEAQEKGIRWLTVEEDFAPAIEEFRKGDVQRVIETAKSRGVENPEPIVELFEDKVRKWTEIVADIGSGEWGDAEWDAYQEKLESEVFSKVQYP